MQWDFPGNGAWNSLSGLYCQVKRESLREWTREGESGREREGCVEKGELERVSLKEKVCAGWEKRKRKRDRRTEIEKDIKEKGK